MKILKSSVKYLLVSLFVALTVLGLGANLNNARVKAFAEEVDGTETSSTIKTISSIESIQSATYKEENGEAVRQNPTIKVLDSEGGEVNAENYNITIQYKSFDEGANSQEIVGAEAYKNAGYYQITATAKEEKSSEITGSASIVYEIQKANISDDNFKFSENSITKNSDDESFTNTLTNTLGLDVSYEVAPNKNVTVNNEGMVTLGRNNEAETEVVVSAIFSGNNNYNAKTVSYTLKVKNYFTITWKLNNGATDVVRRYQYGESLGTGANIQLTPQKEPTEEFEYTFSGWNPIISENAKVVEDKTYEAIFTSKKRTYIITFKVDESIVATKSYQFGEIPSCATPFKSGTNEYAFEFVKWHNDYTENITAVTREAIYSAVFVKRYYTLESDVASSEDEPIAKIISSSGIYEGASFIVNQKEEISFSTPKNSENIVSFSAKLVYGVAPIDLSGEKVKVRIKVEDLPSKTKDIRVAMKNSDGEVELLDVEIDGDYLTFETSKVGDFMVVRDCGNLLATCLISVAIILIVVMVLTVVFIPLLKRQDHSYTEDEEN